MKERNEKGENLKRKMEEKPNIKKYNLKPYSICQIYIKSSVGHDISLILNFIFFFLNVSLFRSDV